MKSILENYGLSGILALIVSQNKITFTRNVGQFIANDPLI